jgi:hypothetical protein
MAPSRIVAVSVLGDIRLWDLYGTGAVRDLDTGISDLRTPGSSADGSVIGAADYSEVVLWNDPQGPVQYASPKGIWGTVGAVDPKGQWFAVSGERSEDGGLTPVYVWKPEHFRNEPELKFLAGESATRSIAFDRSGVNLATGDAAGQIRMWNLAKPKSQPQLLSGSRESVDALAFSVRGGRLAAGSADGSVRLWKFTDPGARPAEIAMQGDAVTSVALSADGTVLAVASQVAGVRLWNVTGERVEARPPVPVQFGARSRVVAFSTDPESRWLASGASIGSAVRLWNWRDPASVPLTIVENFDGNANITGLAFTDGGARLLVSGGTSQLLEWTVDTGKLADLVCNVVQRDLSNQEWIDYIGPTVSYEPSCSGRSGKLP